MEGANIRLKYYVLDSRSTEFLERKISKLPIRIDVPLELYDLRDSKEPPPLDILASMERRSYIELLLDSYFMLQREKRTMDALRRIVHLTEGGWHRVSHRYGDGLDIYQTLRSTIIHVAFYEALPAVHYERKKQHH
jgi:hypothetical protein